MTDTVEIFTDGACRGNPGPGGWGALLRFAGKEKSLYGGEVETTNNRMRRLFRGTKTCVPQLPM